MMYITYVCTFKYFLNILPASSFTLVNTEVGFPEIPEISSLLKYYNDLEADKETNLYILIDTLILVRYK